MKKTAICVLLIALLLSACDSSAEDRAKEPSGSSSIWSELFPELTPAPKPTPAPTSEPTPEPTPEPTSEPTSTPKPARSIRIEDAVVEGNLNGVSIELHYPVIICSEGGYSGDLREVADEIYGGFSSSASEYSSIAAEEGWFANPTYEVTFLSGDLVSFVFHTEDYTGGMHPLHSVFCRTWTWVGGPIYVQDLFNLYTPARDSSAFWDSIMAEIQRQIHEDGDYLYADHVWDGFSLDMLSVADGGLNAYYEEYVLGSYADGEPVFFIPLDKIDASPIEWIAPGFGDPELDPDTPYFCVQDGYLYWYSGPADEVVVPDGVTAIGYSAFSNMTELTSLVLPEGLSVIGMEAFDCCSGLERISLPSTLTEIGYCAFNGATALTDVYYAGTREQWDRIAIDSDNDPLFSAAIHFAG